MRPITYSVLIGNFRRRVFRSAKDFDKFLSILSALRNPQHNRIFHYCLLPNQIHLILDGPVESFYRDLLKEYTTYFKRSWRTTTRIFEHDIPSAPVAPEELLSYGVMLENLPYKYGMASRGSPYPYSSLREYMNAGPSPDPHPILTLKHEFAKLLKHFSMPDELYEDFVRSSNAWGHSGPGPGFTR